MKSALIIGGNSLTGQALAFKLLENGVITHSTSKRLIVSRETINLDLAQPESWPELPKTDVAYLCAAITKLEACEADPQGTRRINVEHMQMLAARVLAAGTHVVFISSNQVFDGALPMRHAHDPVTPLNEYGRQKALMEQWLLAQKEPASVLRITKVIAGRLPILTQWEAELDDGKAIEAFRDLSFAPLPLAQVIEGLIILGQARQRGIYQMSGTREISYYEMACALARTRGFATDLIKPVSAVDKGIRPQFLPQYGTLEPSAIFSQLVCPPALEVLEI